MRLGGDGGGTGAKVMRYITIIVIRRCQTHVLDGPEEVLHRVQDEGGGVADGGHQRLRAGAREVQPGANGRRVQGDVLQTQPRHPSLQGAAGRLLSAALSWGVTAWGDVVIIIIVMMMVVVVMMMMMITLFLLLSWCFTST